MRMIAFLLSALDLRELDLLTSGFVCHSTQEAVRSATTRNQAICSVLFKERLVAYKFNFYQDQVVVAKA